jgi:hypothetical protein
MSEQYHSNFRKASTVLVLLLSGGVATAQDEAVKQKAIEQMRKIATAIKQCPPHKTSSQDECKIHVYYLGPPTNVEWDVVQSKTVRSPFQGTLEFTLPSGSNDINQANLSKKDQQKCADRDAFVAQIEVPASKWHDGHYRYEFDLGSGSPELIKMLWVVKDKDDKTLTSAVTDNLDACWVTAAKPSLSNKTENLSPSARQ